MQPEERNRAHSRESPRLSGQGGRDRIWRLCSASPRWSHLSLLHTPIQAFASPSEPSRTFMGIRERSPFLRVGSMQPCTRQGMARGEEAGFQSHCAPSVPLCKGLPCHPSHGDGLPSGPTYHSPPKPHSQAVPDLRTPASPDFVSCTTIYTAVQTFRPAPKPASCQPTFLPDFP